MTATLPRPTPVAAAAIRVGRALESWGRKHVRHSAGHPMDHVGPNAEARAALDERDRLIWTTTFAPYL